MDVRNYIALYTAVYNFCTAQKTVRTAHLRGEDIYLQTKRGRGKSVPRGGRYTMGGWGFHGYTFFMYVYVVIFVPGFT